VCGVCVCVCVYVFVYVCVPIACVGALWYVRIEGVGRGHYNSCAVCAIQKRNKCGERIVSLHVEILYSISRRVKC
jgi:hypothetical protein